MCNYALVCFVFFKIFITKATVSAPCRLVSYCFSHVYMYYHSTNKMDGWMKNFGANILLLSLKMPETELLLFEVAIGRNANFQILGNKTG